MQKTIQINSKEWTQIHDGSYPNEWLYVYNRGNTSIVYLVESLTEPTNKNIGVPISPLDGRRCNGKLPVWSIVQHGSVSPITIEVVE